MDIHQYITRLSEKLLNQEDLRVDEARDLDAFLSRDARLGAAFERRIDPALLEDLAGVYFRANFTWKTKFEEIRSA